MQLVFEAFGSKLKNHRICWFTDNENVVRIVLYNSKKPILQKKSLAIGVNN